MTCHGKYPGKLTDCFECAVAGSCVSRWNKNHPDEVRLVKEDINKGRE